MGENTLKTPVAFIIFNRPDTTERVFREIQKARPPKLLVIADGPRPDRPGEYDKCLATREIISKVDWDCDILTNFSDVNLGCGRRVSSGLDWVFSQVEEAIILEDDCLPHPTFFSFCQELLETYRDDERIMMISGDNFQFGKRRTNYSYYFSRYSHVWGWASWRRAWKHYDFDMKHWPEVASGRWLRDILGSESSEQYWHDIFAAMHRGDIDTWDIQWAFSLWMQSGLTVLPNVNLITNIGFGPEATHTKQESKVANIDAAEMKFPLEHPPFIIRDALADQFTEKLFFNPGLKARIKRILGI